MPLQVICAYPITPQTHIVEALSAMVKKEDLAAEFLNVESEFAAMSVAIGASAAGARAYPGDGLPRRPLPAHPGPLPARPDTAS